tara:strand:- start:80 stop:346 length:267 start_codon:yes stop_codon:yes gene_type:complete
VVTLTKILWHDASGGSNVGWRDINELKQITAAIAVSCGMVIHEDDEVVIICPHMLLEDGKAVQGDAEIAIPKAWIISTEKLLALPPGD